MVLNWKKLSNRTIWSAYKRGYKYIKAAHMNKEEDLLDAFRIILDYEREKNTSRLLHSKHSRRNHPRVLTTQRELYIAAYPDILDEIRFCCRDPERFKREGQKAFEAFLFILSFVGSHWSERKSKLDDYEDAVMRLTKIDDDMYTIAKAYEIKRRLAIEAQKKAGSYLTVERKVRQFGEWAKEDIDD